jgi:hypothetical protein
MGSIVSDKRSEEYMSWLENREEECVPNDSDCEWCPIIKDCKRVKR